MEVPFHVERPERRGRNAQGPGEAAEGRHDEAAAVGNETFAVNAFAALAHRTSRMQVAGNFKILCPQLFGFMPQRHAAKHHVIGNAPADIGRRMGIMVARNPDCRRTF